MGYCLENVYATEIILYLLYTGTALRYYHMAVFNVRSIPYIIQNTVLTFSIIRYRRVQTGYDVI
jgi:hypothetical protein